MRSRAESEVINIDSACARWRGESLSEFSYDASPSFERFSPVIVMPMSVVSYPSYLVVSSSTLKLSEEK